MTEHSLVIIDELGRSTAVEEGTALAMAVCEELAKSKANVYITTHFTLLTKLADMHLNIKVWQMQTLTNSDCRKFDSFRLDFKFSLVPGVTAVKGYGIYMVRHVFPRRTLKYAQELYGKLPEKLSHPTFVELDERVRLKYQLECKLHKLKEQNKLTVPEINKCLNQFKEDLRGIGENIENKDDVIQELSAELNHSIFDARRSEQTSTQTTDSKVFLNDFYNNSHRLETSSSNRYEISNTSMDSLINPVNITEQGLILEPQIALSYEDSGSLNLTQNAFGLFGVPDRDNDNNYCGSQKSERALSQEVKQIAEYRSLTPSQPDQYIFKQPLPIFNYPKHNNFSDTDSLMDLNEYQFSLHLKQNYKTSTPLNIQKKANVSDLSLSASNIYCPNMEFYNHQKNTPRPNCTIISNPADEVDMQSVQEDLESFVLHLEDDDFDDEIERKVEEKKETDHSAQDGHRESKFSENGMQSIHDELKICSQLLPQVNEIFDDVDLNRPETVEETKERNQELRIMDNATPSKNMTHKMLQRLAERFHIFPRVTVIEGPNNSTPERRENSSSEELPKSSESISYSPLDSIKNTNTMLIPSKSVKNSDIDNELKLCTKPNLKKVTDKHTLDFNTINDILEKSIKKENVTNITEDFNNVNPDIPQDVADQSIKLELASQKCRKENSNLGLNTLSRSTSTVPVIEIKIEVESENNKTTENPLDQSKIPSVQTLAEIASAVLQNISNVSMLVNDLTPKSVVDNVVEPRSEYQSKKLYTAQTQRLLSSNFISFYKNEKDSKDDEKKIIFKRTSSDELVSSYQSVDQSFKYGKDSSNYFTATQESPTIDGKEHNEQSKKINILENMVVQLPYNKKCADMKTNLNNNTFKASGKKKLGVKLSKPKITNTEEFNTQAGNLFKQTIDFSNYDKEISEKIQQMKSKGIPKGDEPQRSSSGETLLKVVQKEKTLTSISEASRIRNLDGDCTATSTSDIVQVCNSPFDEKTSFSEASRKRNLDQVSSSSEVSSNSKGFHVNDDADDIMQCSVTSSSSGNPPIKRNRRQGVTSKNLSPQKKTSKKPKKSKIICGRSRKKFVPPMKQIPEPIQQESTDYEKYWKQRLNQPTERQIKQREYVATLVKTKEGVEVLPAKEQVKRKYKKKYEIQTATRSQISNIDLSIFSDKHSKKFDSFINSDQKDFKTLSFGVTFKENKRDGNLFNFK